MKHGIAIPALILMMFAVGCARQQVKVTFLSDPPGGALYKKNGDLWGPCPKDIFYWLNGEAVKRRYMDVRGVIVRWPTGPEKRSSQPMRITVDGTDQNVTFVQPDEEQKTE